MTKLTKIASCRRWVRKHRFEGYQAGYWLFYGGLTFVKNGQLQEPYQWWEVLLTIAVVMAIIYTIVFILLHRRPVAKTIGLLLGMFIAYAFLFYQLIFTWHPPLGARIFGAVGGMALGGYLFSMFLHWQHSMVEAGLLAAIYRIRRDERLKRELMERKHLVQVQFLTAQIDPHEYANLLNIPYWMAVKAGDRAVAEVLLKVKQRLLYVPEKADGVRSEVPLGDELAQCEKIADLNALRFGKCYMQVNVPAELQRWTVPLFSVSALMQNAFKYGISWDEQCPISLVATGDGNRLTIRLRNKINPGKRDEPSTGIGNGNIRRRLELLYGTRAGLHTVETADGWYESILTLTKS